MTQEELLRHLNQLRIFFEFVVGLFGELCKVILLERSFGACSDL